MSAGANGGGADWADGSSGTIRAVPSGAPPAAKAAAPARCAAAGDVVEMRIRPDNVREADSELPRSPAALQ